MEIVIELATTDPPSGQVVHVHAPDGGSGRADPVAFTGWLGLLAVLSAVVDPSGDPGHR
jgi:hypothetical protein